MNHFQAIVAQLEGDWPDYQIWYVPKSGRPHQLVRPARYAEARVERGQPG